MKFAHNFLEKRTAMSAANIMKYACYFIIGIFIMGIVLSLIGRMEFHLFTPQESFDNAILAEKDHNFRNRALTVSIPDDVYVHADGQVELATRVGLFLIYLVTVAPILVSFCFLASVFKNVGNGIIFTEKNAKYLLYYGLIQIIAAVTTPFIKLFICFVTNFFTGNELTIATGSRIFQDLIPNIAYIVAAYILYYGVQLQDEVDHTL